jgi:hypothetical protein
MPGSLKSLAGPLFSAADVITAWHEPIPVEQLVLDRYVFLPHVRSGIAAALGAPFAWGASDRATVDIEVPVLDDRGELRAKMTVHVHGPANVLELDPGQVIRVYPKVDAAGAEVEDLAHVEFDRPDLPWMFTPAGPDGAGRLVPWITLVVAERRWVRFGERRGATREADIRRDQLQSLAGAWAWAHAQVMGAKDSGPPLEQRVSEANAAHNLSRLVCPRRLQEFTEYVACVVPTFRCGADAGLGLTPATTTLEPAWGSSTDFNAGNPAAMVKLPVYFSWGFATGEKGNFESLARLLKPVVAPAGVGRRRVDATRPWRPLAADPADPGAEIVVEGPVVSLTKPADDPAGGWPADTQWSPDIADELVARLNNPDRQAHESADADAPRPLVGPPLYGSTHAAQPRIETDAAGAAAQPPWFRQVNTDPRDRIVAGLGTRVIQAEQEELMASAWNQVIGVEAANRALRLAQMSMHVSASLHRRHVARLGDAALLAVTERVHAKVLAAPQHSVWSSLTESSLPASATVGAFRRMVAVRGRIVRRAVATRAERLATVETLTVGFDRLTVDWVRPYHNPDGISAFGALARSLLTPEIAARLDPSVDADTLASRWSAQLTSSGMTEALAPEALAHTRIADAVEIGGTLIQAMADRVLAGVPDPEAMRRDSESAITGASNAVLLARLADLAGRRGLNRLTVSQFHARRLRIELERGREDRGPQPVQLAALRAFADRAIEAARALEIRDMPWADFERNATRLEEFVDRNSRIEGQTVFAGLSAMSGKLVNSDRYVDPPRARLPVPPLQLVGSLDPRITVPRRVNARLAGARGMPAWLRADWLADGRIEPVMAHPRFHYPMYEPLYRYDRDWMVPGLGLIRQTEMVTLLETNNRFIEAYLIGLNCEMARELLWRSYPTDQRGTYFDSFWTGQRELVADLHELPWQSGALASHVDPGLGGRLVFLVRGDLVRRYPGVVAHVVRQGTDGAGHVVTDNGVPLFEAGTAVTPRRTLFHVHLTPNLLLVGFDMRREDLDTPGQTWWFTLSENPAEPRFGLDDSREGPITRDNLTFGDFGVMPGQFLDATVPRPSVNFTEPPSNPPPDRSQWGATSAQTAYLLFQLPARAAFLARRMAEEAAPHA